MHYPGADFVRFEMGLVSAVVAEYFTWRRDYWLAHLYGSEKLAREMGVIAAKSSQLTYTAQYHGDEGPCSEKEHIANVNYSRACEDHNKC